MAPERMPDRRRAWHRQLRKFRPLADSGAPCAPTLPFPYPFHNEVQSMRKLLGWIGATVGGSVGWWAGAGAGVMTAVFASAVGTGAGLYLGWWIAERLLD